MEVYQPPKGWSGEWSAVRPETVEALAEALAEAREGGSRLWPVGGGRHGRRRPDGAVTVLDMRGQDAIRRLDRESLVVTVEAGVTVGALAAHLRERGASLCGWRREHPEATIGGLLSAWQPTPHGLWNGSAREACLGLSAIAGSGHRYRYLPAPRKASGPDLRFVFMGGEGVYGVVTAATLSVSPAPEAQAAWEVSGVAPEVALRLAAATTRAGLRAANVLFSGAGRAMRWCFEGDEGLVERWTRVLETEAARVGVEVQAIDPGAYYDPAAGDVRAGADPVTGRGECEAGGVAIWGDLVGLARVPEVLWASGVLYDLSAHHGALWVPREVARAEGVEASRVWWGEASQGGWSGLGALKASLDPAGVLPEAMEGGA